MHKHHCSSYNELIQVIKTVWTQEIGVNYCRALIESMPSRIAACLANKEHSQKTDLFHSLLI